MMPTSYQNYVSIIQKSHQNDGTHIQNYVKICKQAFTSVKIRRPKGTRVGSMETYVVALGLNNDVNPDTLW